MKTKTCRSCHSELPLENFNKNSKTKDGKQSYCRKCQSEQWKVRRAEKGKEIDKATWQRRRFDPDKLQKHKEAQVRWIKNNPEKYKSIWKRTNREYKLKVLKTVSTDGQVKCENCGCDKPEFLEVNHKNGGGGKEYQARHGGNNKKMYAAILSGERNTEDLNILCKPCNNLHYLELKYGPQPFEITWKGSDDE